MPAGGAAGPEVRKCRVASHGAMAVDAIDLDRRGHLAVDVAVAVVVLREVAIHALHALFHVDGGQVHGLLEFLRIVVADGGAVLVEQGAVPVALEDGPEIPAVAVVIGELRVVQCRS